MRAVLAFSLLVAGAGFAQPLQVELRFDDQARIEWVTGERFLNIQSIWKYVSNSMGVNYG